MKEKIICTAIHNVLNKHNINAYWEDANVKGIDGMLTVDYKGVKQKFFVDYKREVRKVQLNELFEKAEKYKPLLIIAGNLFANIKEILHNNQIAYLDLKGNINIETEKFLIKIDGKNNGIIQQEKFGRAFTKAGIKLVMLFLLDEKRINFTYRTIATEAGIATGNVKFILDGLIQEGYALRKNEKQLKLVNKKELLHKWVTAYNEKLKPTLHIGNFRFLRQNDFLNWKKLPLDNTKALWGGEAAGNILTGYLVPETLTIYTTDKRLEIVKNYQIIPDIEGNVKVYQKFWSMKDVDNQAQYLIAYADLIHQNDQRCIETANKIYDQYLANTF